MALSHEKLEIYRKRLLFSRMRILVRHGFYGLLLMHMDYAMDETCPTAYTDGRRIVFSPQFLEGLRDAQLDYVMMHEILHVVLGHCWRCGHREHARFNVACDIVVNSNILLSHHMDLASITLGKQGGCMHLAPDKREGYEYTAEQVYEMLPSMPDEGRSIPFSSGKSGAGQKSMVTAVWDDHSQWGVDEDSKGLQELWKKRLEDACKAICVQDPSNDRGLVPRCAQRMLKEGRRAQMEWRMLLHRFIQEELVDYTFCPPDSRYEESPFYLPGFCDREDVIENILFMIDASGSMSDTLVASAYSEVKGAIDQFDGRLKGWLGFFDAEVVEPKPFEDETQFRLIRPAGGGGTDFEAVFRYVYQHLYDLKPACIVILTDGEAPFPDETLAMEIPVLWLLNNEKIHPPWGKVAYMEAE